MTATSLQTIDTHVEDAALAAVAGLGVSVPRKGVLSELDAMAAAVMAAGPLPEDAKGQASRLASVIFKERDPRGNRKDYYDPRNSYLHEVLGRGLGIPITLGIVLLAVARRVGIDAEGVAFPGHFLVRIGGSGVLVDPFARGRAVGDKGLARLTKKYLGAPENLEPRHLEGASVPVIVARLLSNLQYAYQRRGDFAMAMVVVDRLVDLFDSPDHYRDRGLLAIALGSYESAASDIARYIAARPDARDVPTLEVALEQVKGQIGTNLQ